MRFAGTIFRVLQRGLRNGARADSFSHTICTVVSTTHFFLLDQSKNKKICIHDTAKPTKKKCGSWEEGKKSGLKDSSVLASYGKAF